MRIAISTDGDFVSAHFGRCPSFTILDIEDSKIIKQYKIANPGHQPGFIPQFLHDMGVECIVSGGIGSQAALIFEEYGIRKIVGISGKIDDIVEQLKKGNLQSKDSLCEHSSGKGYELDKSVCDHQHKEKCDH
jgi:predicted Fe-Mo cluster-binding NifX family protein